MFMKFVNHCIVLIDIHKNFSIFFFNFSRFKTGNMFPTIVSQSKHINPHKNNYEDFKLCNVYR